MTCTHINQANQQLRNLNLMLYNLDSRVYEEKGPYAKIGSIGVNHSKGVIFRGCSYSEYYTSIRPKEISKEVIEREITSITNMLNLCNCKESESSRADLENRIRGMTEDERIRERNNHEKELKDERDRQERERNREREDQKSERDRERNDFIRQLEEQKEKYSEVERKIEEGKKETSLIRTENPDLQLRLGLSQSQAEELDKKLAEALVREHEANNQVQVRDNTIGALRNALLSISNQNTWNAASAHYLGRNLEDTQYQLILRESRLESLEDDRNNLQVVLANQAVDLRQLRENLKKVIEERDEQVERLKEGLKQVKEESLELKINTAESKLEGLIEKYQLTEKHKNIDSLLEVHHNLVKIKSEENRNKIRNIRSIILQSKIVKVRELQEINDVCEQIAKLQVEQEQLFSEQYQAKIEIPTN